MVSQIELSQQLFEEYSKRLAQDNHLFHSHIALISALFYYHDKKHPLGVFQCSRSKLMLHSHIRSTATYHRRLKDLVKSGYLEYIPSWHPTKASSFRFLTTIKIISTEEN